MKKSIIVLLAAITGGLYSFTQAYQSKDWVVPESAQKVKNPTNKTDKADIAVGKTLYAKQCQSCHGKEGFGDGPKAKEMKGDMGDFSSDKFQAQTDGTLFYKITNGHGDMPAFDKKIPDEEDRWLIVNYLRTLKEK